MDPIICPKLDKPKTASFFLTHVFPECFTLCCGYRDANISKSHLNCVEIVLLLLPKEKKKGGGEFLYRKLIVSSVICEVY